jgi:hypothetical protein
MRTRLDTGRRRSPTAPRRATVRRNRD